MLARLASITPYLVRILRGSRTRRMTGKRGFQIEALESRLLLSADLAGDLPWASCVTGGEPPAQLIVVDGSLQDNESLLNALSGSNPLILDRSGDGIEQITQALAQRSGIGSIHIFSHGSPGSVALGNTTLNSESVEAYRQQLQAWAGALTADADILFYACDLAQGEQGVLFVDELSRLTGADIAASSDQSGSPSLGGDWDLEYAAGTIETAPITPELAAESFVLSSVGYSGTQLSFEADFHEADQVVVSATTEHTLVIRVANTDSIHLTFQNNASSAFVLSDSNGGRDNVLTVNLEVAPVNSFFIALGDEDDSLDFSLPSNLPFGNNISIIGQEGNDTVALSSLYLNGPLSVTAESIGLGGTIKTEFGGNQTYNGAVVLAADTTLTGRDILFSQSIDSDGTPRALAVNTISLGTMTFGGTVGATSPLASLTTNADGTTAINGGMVVTIGNQSYNDAITLGADAVLSATDAAGKVAIGHSLSAGANDVTLSARVIDLPPFGGSVSGTGTITLQPEADATPIVLGIMNFLQPGFYLSDPEIAALATGFSQIVIGRPAGTGTITVHSNGASFGDDVMLRATGTGGAIVINGTLRTTANLDRSSVTLNGSGATTLNANIVTAGGDIVINDNVILGFLPLSVTLDTTNADAAMTGANITIAGSVDGHANSLLLFAGSTGDVDLQGAIGLSTPVLGLAVNSADDVSLPEVKTYEGGVSVFTTNPTNPSITLNGNINTTGSVIAGHVNLSGAVVLASNVTITTDGPAGPGADGNVSFMGSGSTINADFAPNMRTLTVDAGSGDVSFGGVVGASQAPHALLVNEANRVTLQAVRTRDGGLSVQALNGPILLNGPISTTDGTNAGHVSLRGPVNLTSNVTITTDSGSGSDGNVNFVGSESPINADNPGGMRTLEIDAGLGDVNFGGGVGGMQLLQALSINEADDVIFQFVRTRGGVSVSTAGASPSIALNGPIMTTEGGNVSMTGPVILNSNITINTDTLSGTDGNVSFVGSNSTIDADSAANLRRLNVDAGSGDVNLGGAIGNTQPLEALTVDEGDDVTLQAVRTRGGGLSILTAGADPSIILNGAINTTGGFGAGNVILTGRVILMANITITADGGGGGNVTFAGPGSTINADNSVNLRTLNVDAGAGDVTFGGAIGDTQPLHALTINDANDVILQSVKTRDGGLSVVTAGGSPSIMLNGAINTTGAINAGNVSLTGPVILTANITVATDSSLGTDGNVSFVGATSSINADSMANTRTLSITSGNGNILLAGSIGATQALGTLTIDTSAGLTLPGIVVSGGVNVHSAANGSATLVAGNITAGAMTLNAGGSFTNSAVIAATGISIHSAGAFTNSAGAAIAGSGTLTGTTFSNSGTLRPGGSGAAGNLAIVANTNLATTGVLEMELLGAGAGQYDTLQINGPVAVQGILTAQLAGGFSPASGNRFRFMTFNSRTGFFGATNLPADFVVDQTDPAGFELVFAPNDPPVANADAYSTDENSPLILAAPGVLANDADADGDALTAVLVTGPSHGTLVLNANGSFTYTPNSGFNGADGFTYRANDGTDSSGLSTVTITVDPLSTIFGLVYEDTNNNGQVDFGEQAIANVTLHLTGIDNLGQAVSLSTTTDVDGVYIFTGLRRGTYGVIEEQPAGYSDGMDSPGTVNGVVTGNNSVNDALSGILITQPGSVADNYNFGERANGGAQQSGQTANIGFWQNSTGRALLQSLNGGPNSTALGNWLATNFSNMWGANAGASDLTGKTNVEVADFYSRLFARTKKEMAQAGLGGPVKMEAQVLAVALAVYVTDTDLAGTTAVSYGFHVDSFGIGARTFNVGNNGLVFDLADGTQARIIDLLLAANRHAHHGILYDEDHDGDSNNSLEVLFRTMANEVFSAINQNGSI
jgi:hypothetical protein